VTHHLSTINDLFKNTVKEYPHKTALIFKEEKYTFTELDQLVEQIAAYFYSKGLKKQERIIIYLPHMWQWVAIWLAMQRIGVIPIPVTHFYGHEELGYIAKDSETKTIFCMDRNLDQVVKAAAVSRFERIIVVGDEFTTESMPDVDGKAAEILSFSSILKESVPPLPAVPVEPTDLAEILYTGGTTGYPKGVPLTQIMLLIAMETKRSEFVSIVPKGQGVALQGAPLNHILGKELGFSSLLSGDTLILLPRMELEDLFAHIEKYKVTTLFGTPTLCRMILEHEKEGHYDFSSLGYVFTAGEAMPVEVARRWEKMFNKKIYNGYGSTETCGGITGTPVDAEDYPDGTIGKVVPNKEVMLLDPDTGERVAPGEPGEVLVRAEHMVTAYLNKPEETARHFVNIDGKIWYKTGDIVRFDEKGWGFFVDRSVDLIKHKGYRVAASKVEAVLYKHDAVSECCVVGVPDEKVGEKIKAFVVLKAGVKNVTADDLIKWCQESLSSYEIPNYLEFRAELPKSAVGKILRRKLRDEERQNYELRQKTG
jgi:long-chain acyl-CoA synthetase